MPRRCGGDADAGVQGWTIPLPGSGYRSRLDDLRDVKETSVLVVTTRTGRSMSAYAHCACWVMGPLLFASLCVRSPQGCFPEVRNSITLLCLSVLSPVPSLSALCRCSLLLRLWTGVRIEPDWIDTLCQSVFRVPGESKNIWFQAIPTNEVHYIKMYVPDSRSDVYA